MSWFDESCEHIRAVIAANPDIEVRSPEMRRLVSEAYPYWPRKGYPYKAWLRATTAILGPSPKKIAAERAKLDEFHRRLGQESLEIEVQP